MAVTVTNVSASGVATGGRNEFVLGERRSALYRVTLSNSYPAGGESFDPNAFGFAWPVATLFLDVRKVAATLGRHFEYDFVNKKIFVYVTSTGVEAGAVDLSTVIIDCLVVGE